MIFGYLVIVLVMIWVGEKLLQCYGVWLLMMVGLVLIVIVIVLIFCIFFEKVLYIGVVFVSNVLFGFGLGCYVMLLMDIVVVNVLENKIGVVLGIYKMGSLLGGVMGIVVIVLFFVLFLLLGMVYVVQYVLWFNVVLCLGVMVVSVLLLLCVFYS